MVTRLSRYGARYQGFGSSLALASALYSLGSSGTIAITTPVRYQTLQRSGGDQAAIAITGTYTGSPAAIEASFNGGGYATIDAAPSAGSYSGTLSAQAAGQGTLTVRFTNNTGVNTTELDIGIGDVFVVAGQSNAEGYGANPQSYTYATLKATVFRENDAWDDCTDPTDVDGAGSYWPHVATYFLADQSVPVAFITTALSGSGLHIGSWMPGGALYVDMQSQVTAAATGANGVKAVLFHQGEADALATVSRADYLADIIDLGAGVVADLPGAPRLFVIQVGPDVSPVTGDDIAAIRLAQQDGWDASADIDEGPCIYDFALSGGSNDGVHFKTDADLLALGQRVWAGLETAYYGGTATAPKITGAVLNVARTEIVVTFNQTLKTGLTFDEEPWRVFDDGTPMTVSSVGYHANPAAVTVTMSAAATGPADTVTFSLNDGYNAQGFVTVRGTDVTLPTSGTVNLRSRVAVDEAVDEAPPPTVRGRRGLGIQARFNATGNAQPVLGGSAAGAAPSGFQSAWARGSNILIQGLT